MRRLRFLFALSTALALTAQARHAAAEPERRAIQLSLFAGPAFGFCSTQCSEVGAGFDFGAAGAFRLSRALAFDAFFDRAYVSWSPELASKQLIFTTQGAIGLRYYPFDFGAAEPFVELAAGGTSWDATGAHSEGPRGGITLTPIVGFDYRFSPELALGARGSVGIVFPTVTGSANPGNDAGPHIPDVDRIGRFDLVVTYLTGPSL